MSVDISMVERFLGEEKKSMVLVAEFQKEPPRRNKALSLMGSTLRELFTGLGIDPAAIQAEIIEFTSDDHIVHEVALGVIDVLSLDDGFLSPGSKVWRLNWQLSEAQDGTHPSAASIVFAEEGERELAGFNILTATEGPTIEPHDILQGFIKRYEAERQLPSD